MFFIYMICFFLYRFKKRFKKISPAITLSSEVILEKKPQKKEKH